MAIDKAKCQFQKKLVTENEVKDEFFKVQLKYKKIITTGL